MKSKIVQRNDITWEISTDSQKVMNNTISNSLHIETKQSNLSPLFFFLFSSSFIPLVLVLWEPQGPITLEVSQILLFVYDETTKNEKEVINFIVRLSYTETNSSMSS